MPDQQQSPSAVQGPGMGARLIAGLDRTANRLYDSKYNPLYHSGAVAVGLLAVLIVTGIYLLLFYRIGAPHASVVRINDQAWAGSWIRGLHRYASDAVIVAVAVHAFRMFAQRRTWGPRALAWVSGVMLVTLVMICGWTGFVLVWDSHAHLLATEGARLLDALPIFSEPIGRSFVTDAQPPAGFFFLNLFIHIALPLSLGLVLWVHVARLTRPVLLPSRPVLWGVVGLLALAGMLWAPALGPEASGLARPAHIPLNLFYAFWLPIAQRVPVYSVYAAGALLIGLVIAIPWLTRPRPVALPAPATVNERTCTGCEQCVADCPYDAIEMVPRVDERAGMVARVKTELCTACGICVGSCPPMSIGPRAVTGRDQIADVRAFIERTAPGSSDVVVVGCEWSAAHAEAARTGARYFPVPCVGEVHSSTVELLLRGGAGGVLVVGCPEHDGRTREGVTWAEERLFHGRLADLKPRVDRRRVRLVQANLSEGGRLHAAVRAFADEIDALADKDVDILAVCKARSEPGSA